MSEPTRYAGGALVEGKVADFEKSLNPLNWPTTASYLWTDVYLIPPVLPALIDDPGPVGVGPEGGTDPATGLPRNRSSDPARAAPRDSWDSAKLFEGANFAGFLYRNILQTSLVKMPDQISFHYEQVECLETIANRPFDGGIDIDIGDGSATKVNGSQVQVNVSKTVRFTQPSNLVADVNLLAHVMVPLSFDFWLHCGLFTQGE